jgi:hypothetical protein
MECGKSAEDIAYLLSPNCPSEQLRYSKAYHTIERDPATSAHFYSLVHIFDECDALMFIDTGHVTPMGNEVIAKRMLDIMQAHSS